MTTLTWDQVGERLFETGVSKGVLYKADGFGVSWSGLTSVDDNVSNTTEPVYFDGVKFADVITPGDFTAILRAFTYPEEFLLYEGTVEDEPGFYLLNQPPQFRFGLSYQTKTGDDVNGSEAGYKIHLLYNLTAQPSQKSYQTFGDTIEPIEFEWNLTAVPEDIEGFRPTAHVVLDSRRMDPYLLRDIEAILYGEAEGSLQITDNGDGTWTAYSDVPGMITDNGDGSFEIVTDSAVYLDDDTYIISDSAHNAYLPSLSSLIKFIREWQRLVITDHGDGSWSAYSSVPGVIVMLTDTSFVITSDTAEFIGPDTYKISSSDKDENDIWLPPIPPLP